VPRARAPRAARTLSGIAEAESRVRGVRTLGPIFAALAIVVVIAIAVAVSTSGGAGTAARSTQAAELFRGLSERNGAIGDPRAPLTVTEFVDLQCPFCAEASKQTLPTLVEDYVRTGKVRMEFRALAFIGPDSVRAARVVEAAGRQNKLWNLVDLVYFNQGRENSGYATDAFLRRLAGAVPGLDVGRVFAERDGAAVSAQLNAADGLAARSAVNETPTFLVGRGTALRAVDAAGLPAAIKAAIGS
jgi:protein-disulfide isomerase